MKRFFGYLSVKKKLMVVFLPLVACSIIIMASVCFYLSSIQLKVNSEKQLEDAVRQSSSVIDDKLQDVQMKMASITTDESYRYMLTRKKNMILDSEYLQYNNQLRKEMMRVVVDHSDLIDSIIIKTKNELTFQYMCYTAPYRMTATYQDLYTKANLKESQGLYSYTWENYHSDDVLITRNERTVFTAYAVMGNPDSSEGMVMVVNMFSQPFEKLLNNISSAEKSFSGIASTDSCYFTNDQFADQVLSEEARNNMKYLSGSGTYVLNGLDGKDYLIGYAQVELNGWNVISIVPMKELMLGTEVIQAAMIPVTILMLCLASIPVLMISKLFSNDFTRLTNTLEKYEGGEEDVIFETSDRNEIFQLANGLNSLTNTVKHQIEEIRIMERRKRQTEFLLLQSQINPHFLYNTLISVKSLMDVKKYDEAGIMFQSLISFLISSLNHGKETITLKEEIDIVSNYLTILAYRYDYSFEWCINVDPDILDAEILKLTLQPLVENAIYHGVKMKKEKGIIDISGCELNDEIILTVWDNGVGMSKEKLEELQYYISCDMEIQEDRKHFGLWNCNQRIRLNYGMDYGLEIDSEEGAYTNITIRIPYRKGAV